MLTPHLALVTGATGGIGRATSDALAALNCSLALHFNSSLDAALSLRSDILAKYPSIRVECFQADLSAYDSVRQLHASVVAKMGHPTILYNNAGMTLKHGVKSVDEVSVEEFEETWRVNCGSAYLLTKLCLPHMVKREWGRVIFCGSVAGFTGGVVGPHYASSKSALHGLVHWLSGAYSNKGITVNAIAPALIKDTKMLPGDSGDLSKNIPVGRLGCPEEVADTVIWMIKTGYVTNKVVVLDGGIFAH